MPENPLPGRLRSIRAKLGLSQEDAAKLVKTTPRTLGSWEREVTEPSASHLVNLSRGYDVSVAWLLGLCDHEQGLTPGMFLIDLAAVESPVEGAEWAAKIPARYRIVELEERDRIRDQVNARRRAAKGGEHGRR